MLLINIHLNNVLGKGILRNAKVFFFFEGKGNAYLRLYSKQINKVYLRNNPLRIMYLKYFAFLLQNRNFYMKVRYENWINKSSP